MISKPVLLREIPLEMQCLCVCGNCLWWNNSYKLLKKCRIDKQERTEDESCER